MERKDALLKMKLRSITGKCIDVDSHISFTQWQAIDRIIKEKEYTRDELIDDAVEMLRANNWYDEDTDVIFIDPFQMAEMMVKFHLKSK
jgi:hypothetical protein